MNEQDAIEKILAMKKIAVVGLSGNPDRPSFSVARYLEGKGFEIIPVNPSNDSWMGHKSFPDIPSVLQKIEVVDIFRKSEAVPEIVKQAIAVGAKAVWMQEGVKNEAAAHEAEAAGLLVVMDRCIRKEHEKRLRQ